MYDFLPHRHRRAVRDALSASVRSSVLLPIAIPLGVAVLLGGLAALAGADPIDFAGAFLGQAAVAVAGITAKLWAACFLCAAFCFGISRSLPYLLQHRPLDGRIVARFTRAIALVAPWVGGVTALASGPIHRFFGQIRAGPLAPSAPSSLAGAVPQLE